MKLNSKVMAALCGFQSNHKKWRLLWFKSKMAKVCDLSFFLTSSFIFLLQKYSNIRIHFSNVFKTCFICILMQLYANNILEAKSGLEFSNNLAILGFCYSSTNLLLKLTPKAFHRRHKCVSKSHYKGGIKAFIYIWIKGNVQILSGV